MQRRPLSKFLYRCQNCQTPVFEIKMRNDTFDHLAAFDVHENVSQRYIIKMLQRIDQQMTTLNKRTEKMEIMLQDIKDEILRMIELMDKLTE